MMHISLTLYTDRHQILDLCDKTGVDFKKRLLLGPQKRGENGESGI